MGKMAQWGIIWGAVVVNKAIYYFHTISPAQFHYQLQKKITPEKLKWNIIVFQSLSMFKDLVLWYCWQSLLQ
jgi:hypothetical protein